MARNVPKIKIMLDRWTFTPSALSRRGDGEVDLTGYITRYTFQKTIKNPVSGAQLVAFPQSIGRDQNLSLFDEIKPRDVIRIYEYGRLKFQGYITRVQFSGVMAEQPQRSVTLSVAGFGGLLANTSLGLTIGDVNNNALEFIAASQELMKELSDATVNSATFAELVKIAIEKWFDYISSVGASAFVAYARQYLDYQTLVFSGAAPGIPKELALFTGAEEKVSLWSILQKLVEVPLQELWFDETPRTVHIGGTEIKGQNEKTSLILRPTPFDGTVVNGKEERRFSAVQTRQIPLGRLVGFDLARSMDEVVSVYNVIPAAYDLGDLTRNFLGHLKVDETALAKYLVYQAAYRLSYIRSAETNETKRADVRSIEKKMDDIVATLYNWFSRNDEYLSGSLSLIVPPDGDEDFYIGDKARMETLGYMYVEGVTHTWSYGGVLKSTLSVTRGYDSDQSMVLRDKVFLSGNTRHRADDRLKKVAGGSLPPTV